MAPGRKRGTSKVQATEVPLTEYERERAQTMMRNNQVLQNLGVTALASILNSSNAKTKRVAREDSGSVYGPGDDEDNEQGVVDKDAMQVSQTLNTLTTNTIMPNGGARGSKRVMVGPVQDILTARVTRQMTKEASSTEGVNGTSTNEEDDAVVAADAQVDEEDQMGNEGDLNAMRNTRGRSMGKDLDRISRGLNTKLPLVIEEGKRRPNAPMQAAKLASEGGIVLRQHMPIHTHWKEYKKDG